MQNKYIILLGSVFMLSACSELTLHEDYSKATAKNRALQTLDLTASSQERPVAKLDGQKGAKVVQEYRQETSKAPDEALTK